MKAKKALYSSAVLLTGVFLAVALQAFAFTEPASTPPNGDLAAPINTGGASQDKAAGNGTAWITADSLGSRYTTTLSTVSGNVGVGTISPAHKLDVSGDINASTQIASPKYCIGASCITSWPSGSGVNAFTCGSGQAVTSGSGATLTCGAVSGSGTNYWTLNPATPPGGPNATYLYNNSGDNVYTVGNAFVSGLLMAGGTVNSQGGANFGTSQFDPASRLVVNGASSLVGAVTTWGNLTANGGVTVTNGQYLTLGGTSCSTWGCAVSAGGGGGGCSNCVTSGSAASLYSLALSSGVLSGGGGDAWIGNNWGNFMEVGNHIFGGSTGIYVFGNIWASGSKSFIIPYPGDSSKSLVHAAIEGPEAAVYYRGEGNLTNGKATVELPSYFEALTRTDGRTVTLTPEFTDDEPISSLAASYPKNGKFMVRGIDQNNPNQKFFWEVKAVRADLPPLQVVQGPVPHPPAPGN